MDIFDNNGGIGGADGSGLLDPNEYKVDYSDMADAGLPNMMIMARGQVEQAKMQDAMMTLMSRRLQEVQQGKLATNLEISKMNVTVNMQEAQYRHDEKLLKLLNQHIETMVDDGQIDKETLGATSNYHGPDSPESSDNEDVD